MGFSEVITELTWNISIKERNLKCSRLVLYAYTIF